MKLYNLAITIIMILSISEQIIKVKSLEVFYTYDQLKSIGLTSGTNTLYTIKNGTFLIRDYYKCSISFGTRFGNYCEDQVLPGQGCSCPGIQTLTNAHYANTDVFNPSTSYELQYFRYAFNRTLNRIDSYSPSSGYEYYCENSLNTSTIVHKCNLYLFSCSTLLSSIRNNTCVTEGTHLRNVQINYIPKSSLASKSLDAVFKVDYTTEIDVCDNYAYSLPVNETACLVRIINCYYDNPNVLQVLPFIDYKAIYYSCLNYLWNYNSVNSLTFKYATI